MTDNVKDAVERACQNNGTLHMALASVAIWETCRIVEQALKNTASGERGPGGELYDTVFGYTFRLVLERWAELHQEPAITASTMVFGGTGPGQPSGNTEHAPRLRYVGRMRGMYEMVGCSCGLRCDSDGLVEHLALVLK